MSVLLTEQKINDILLKIDLCGNELIEIVSPVGEIKEIVKYCDNRACNAPACIVHRQYQYKRYHGEQIKLLDKNIVAPKAWIFTGWVFPYPIDREFCRQKLRELFLLLNNHKIGSVTEFSIHMEVKLRENDWYLHFHVVSGGLGDMHFMRYLWGRVVTYEHAIKKDALSAYVSKYASKTPLFRNEIERLYYLQFIYKTQTSRFSCGKSSYTPSGCYLYSTLEWEAYCLTKRDNETKGGGYSDFCIKYENRKSKEHSFKDKRFIENWETKSFFEPDTFENFIKKVKESSLKLVSPSVEDADASDTHDKTKDDN
jgi:hypothetical protein